MKKHSTEWLPSPKPAPRSAVETPAVRLAKLMARVNDRVLLEVLDKLTTEGHAPMAEQGFSITAVLTELEQRHPQVDDALDAWVATQPEDEGIEQVDYARACVRIYREAGVGA